MQDALAIVIVVVAVAAALVAVATLLSSGGQYDRIGRGDLTFDHDAPGTASDPARDDEIRQLLEARNARRAAQGREPVDVEAELAALSRPQADDSLRAEIRGFVEARNARRLARGAEPLDVEAEIERRLSDLDG